LDHAALLAGQGSRLEGTEILNSVANVGLQGAAERIAQDYLDGRMSVFLEGPFRRDALVGVVVAIRAVKDPNVVDRVLAAVDATKEWAEDPPLQAAMTDTIGALAAFRFYPWIESIFEDSRYPYARSRAAQVLASHRVLGTPERIVERLSYAEPDVEAPQLGIALAVFDDDRAVSLLAHGLRHSYVNYAMDAHDEYASALRKLSHPSAAVALQKWHRRI
jgi:hypothetical protein